MRITDNFRISKSHWYGRLPRRVQTFIVAAGIKLGFIHRYGKIEVIVNHPDGSYTKRTGYNILTNLGLKHMEDILVGVEATNIEIGYIEPGSGTTTPVIGDTDTETPLTTADRQPVASQTRSTTSPFEVLIEGFISSTTYTRPQTINELAIFFTPDETGDLFARGVLSSGIVLGAGDTATLTYGFVFR